LKNAPKGVFFIIRILNNKRKTHAKIDGVRLVTKNKIRLRGFVVILLFGATLLLANIFMWQPLEGYIRINKDYAINAKNYQIVRGGQELVLKHASQNIELNFIENGDLISVNSEDVTLVPSEISSRFQHTLHFDGATGFGRIIAYSHISSDYREGIVYVKVSPKHYQEFFTVHFGDTSLAELREIVSSMCDTRYRNLKHREC